MNISEYRTFLIAPFDTGHNFEAGQFESMNEDKLTIRLKESYPGIDECSKISLAEQFSDVYPSRNRRVKQISLLKIGLADYQLTSPVQIKFQNNSVYLYEWGTGVLVTEVSIITQNITSGSSLKELENEIIKLFKKQFLTIAKGLIQKFILFTRDLDFKHIDLHTGDNSETSLAWVHSIYCMWGGEYFEKEMGIMGWELKDEIKREFSNLLDQVPEDMSPAIDTFVFYGWGRSLFVIKNSTIAEHLNTINRVIFLMQLVQNISLALYQLESILNERIYDIEPDRPNVKKGSGRYEERYSDITLQIAEIQRIRNSTFKFLEQFHYSSNILMQNSERLLLEKLENQWKLGNLETSIRDKLNILEDRLREKGQFLYSQEQHDSLIKQDSLNKLFLWLTLVSIVSVFSQLVILDPISNILSHHDFFLSQFFWTIILSVAIIMVLLFIYSVSLRNTLSRVRPMPGRGSVS